jgi:hypothetical protein
MVERMLMYYGEGLADRDILLRGYHALGVLDDDPPILGVVKLLGGQAGPPEAGGVSDIVRGHVAENMQQCQFLVQPIPPGRVEQVERAQSPVAL